MKLLKVTVKLEMEGDEQLERQEVHQALLIPDSAKDAYIYRIGLAGLLHSARKKAAETEQGEPQEMVDRAQRAAGRYNDCTHCLRAELEYERKAPALTRLAVLRGLQELLRDAVFSSTDPDDRSGCDTRYLVDQEQLMKNLQDAINREVSK